MEPDDENIYSKLERMVYISIWVDKLYYELACFQIIPNTILYMR